MPSFLSFFKKSSRKGYTEEAASIPLVVCADRDIFEIVSAGDAKALEDLHIGNSIDKLDQDDNTLLHRAIASFTLKNDHASYNPLAIIRHLLESNINPNTLNKKGERPIEQLANIILQGKYAANQKENVYQALMLIASSNSDLVEVFSKHYTQSSFQRNVFCSNDSARRLGYCLYMLFFLSIGALVAVYSINSEANLCSSKSFINCIIFDKSEGFIFGNMCHQIGIHNVTAEEYDIQKKTYCCDVQTDPWKHGKEADTYMCSSTSFLTPFFLLKGFLGLAIATLAYMSILYYLGRGSDLIRLGSLNEKRLSLSDSTKDVEKGFTQMQTVTMENPDWLFVPLDKKQHNLFHHLWFKNKHEKLLNLFAFALENFKKSYADRVLQTLDSLSVDEKFFSELLHLIILKNQAHDYQDLFKCSIAESIQVPLIKAYRDLFTHKEDPLDDFIICSQTNLNIEQIIIKKEIFFLLPRYSSTHDDILQLKKVYDGVLSPISSPDLLVQIYNDLPESQNARTVFEKFQSDDLKNAHGPNVIALIEMGIILKSLQAEREALSSQEEDKDKVRALKLLDHILPEMKTFYENLNEVIETDKRSEATVTMRCR